MLLVLAAYAAYRGRGVTEAGRPLVGLIEAANAIAYPEHVDPPVRVAAARPRHALGPGQER